MRVIAALFLSSVVAFGSQVHGTNAAQTAYTALNFSTPSRNIVCWASAPASPSGDLVCVVLSSFGGAQDFPEGGYLPVRGRAAIRRESNAGDIEDSLRHTVPYGRVWRRGFLRCTSRRTGLTCVSSYGEGGHGFFLSRRTRRAW